MRSPRVAAAAAVASRALPAATRMLRAVLAEALVIAAVAWMATAAAMPGPGPACTTSANNGSCGPYSYSPQITSSNGFTTYVVNNVWNYITGTTQTLTAATPGSWYVTANVPSGNTSVVSYPDTQQLYSNTPIDGYASLTSSFTESFGALAAGLMAEAAYDIWANNYGNEIMVWTDNHGQSLAFDTNLGVATIAGQSWTIYRNGAPGGELIVALNGYETTGTVDIRAILTWLEGQSYLPAASTLSAIDWGAEFSSTGGNNQTFSVSCYTISENTANQPCNTGATPGHAGRRRR